MQHKRYVRDTLRHAWQQVKGSKWPAFLCFFVIGAVSYIGSFYIRQQREPGDMQSHDTFLLNHIYWPTLFYILIASTLCGLFMIGLKRARTIEITAREGFSYYRYFFKASVMFLITFYVADCITIATSYYANYHAAHDLAQSNSPISTVILILIIFGTLFGLLIKLLTTLSPIILIEQNAGPIEALLKSIKALWKHFWPALRLIVTLGVLNLLATAAFGVGLLWTVPLTFIAFGHLYQDIFEPEAALQPAAMEADQ